MASEMNPLSSENKSSSLSAPQICSIIPPYLLEDILSNDAISGTTRAALEKTLNHCSRLHEQRISRQDIPQPLADEQTAGDDATVIEGLHRIIYDSEETDNLRKVLVFEEGGDISSLEENPSAKEVFGFFGKIYQFYKEEFARHSIDSRGHRIIGSVHYDDKPGPPGMVNAFWDGDEMAFGDGDGEIFGSFTKILDIIAHEFTHGVVQYEAGLPYEYQSGALNESFADVFGSMIKQYFHPGEKQLAVDADWLIGEGLFMPSLSNAKALRSMEAPGTAYNIPGVRRDRQPADMDGYRELANTRAGDWGGVHIYSGIPNRAFFLVATSLKGYSWDRAGKIWYAALQDRELRGVNTKTAFKVFADLTAKHALGLYDAEVQAVVNNAWVKVKVYPSTNIHGGL